MSESQSKGVNVIFLDIDGVLNTTTDHEKMSKDFYFVRPDLVDKLVTIVVNTDAKIVLSSTWRYSVEMTEYVRKELNEAISEKKGSKATEDVLISVTPDLSQPEYEEKPLDEKNHQTRTDEIILWLKENAVLSMEHFVRKQCVEHTRKQAALGCIEEDRWLLKDKINVNNFICLDDMNLFYFSCYRIKSKIKEHLVLTKTTKGLSDAHVELAIKILMSDFDINVWGEGCLMACDRPGCFHNKIRKEKKIIEQIKRSSLNMKLEIKPTKAKSAPASKLNRVEEKPRSQSDSKAKKSKVDDGFSFVL